MVGLELVPWPRSWVQGLDRRRGNLPRAVAECWHLRGPFEAGIGKNQLTSPDQPGK